jgi:hypothetical protein
MDNFDEMEIIFAEKFGRTSKCPPPEMLLAHRQGALPDEARAAVEKHLMQCRICPILLADLDSMSQEALSPEESRRIRSRIPAPASRPPVNRWQLYAAAVAACAVLAVGITLVVAHRGTSPGAKRPSSLQLASIPIEKLSLPQTLSPELALRGDVSSTEPTFAELEPAFDAYQKNNYRKAADQFAELAKQFPKSDIPILYLGVSQLFLSQNEAALGSLAQAETIARPERRDAAAWYYAVAAARSQAPNAGPLLRSVCSNHASSYAQKACSVLSSSGSLQ